MPAASYGLMGPEREIALDQVRPDRRGDIHHKPGSTGQGAGLDAPGRVDVPREKCFAPPQRVAPVYAGPGAPPPQRVPATFVFGFPGLGPAGRNARVLPGGGSL